MSTHPPVAHRVVCVDFDGTIRPWGGLFADVAPFPGVPEAMEALHLRCYRIVILTSRMSKRWWCADYKAHGYTSPLAFGEANRRYVSDYLATHGIPFDEITAEKVPAEAYFDDKALQADAGVLPILLQRWLAQ